MIVTTTSQKRRPLTAPRHVARRASAHRKAVASRQRPTREAPWPPCLPRPRPTPTRRAASNPPLIVGAALGPRIAPLAALLQARGESRRDRRSLYVPSRSPVIFPEATGEAVRSLKQPD